MIQVSEDIVTETIHELEDETMTLLTVLGMSAFGGLVSWLREKGPKKFSKLVIILCTAAFAGLLAYYITHAIGLNDKYQCAVSGIAGYGGGTLLDEVIEKAKEFIRNKGKK